MIVVGNISIILTNPLYIQAIILVYYLLSNIMTLAHRRFGGNIEFTPTTSSNQLQVLICRSENQYISFYLNITMKICMRSKYCVFDMQSQKSVQNSQL